MAEYNFSSRKPIARVWYTGAYFVPIAVPFTCLKNVSSRQKVLFPMYNALMSNVVKMVCLGMVSGRLIKNLLYLLSS